jgi:hypothetical protein
VKELTKSISLGIVLVYAQHVLSFIHLGAGEARAWIIWGGGGGGGWRIVNETLAFAG